ncbi:MAG: DUF190 domain-containing protein [Candidatus Wallbacteria bacterium]|nr:DUF190 domain-containing protein [Candidatus Wallbacteria bacterium]
MNLGGRAKRVRIYVNEGDLIGNRAAHVAILELLRREGCAGATVLRAVEGFTGSQVFSTRLVDVEWKLPLIIEWVDMPSRVDRLMPRLQEMLKRGLVTSEEVTVEFYGAEPIRDLSSAWCASDVMTRDAVSVARDAPVRQVVESMLGQIYRAVPVLDSGIPAGIITNSDLATRAGLGVRLELLRRLDESARRVELEKLNREQKSAEDVMTPGPVTVHQKAPLTAVAELMAHRRLKRLPVVDDRGVFVGMISRLDLLRTVTTQFEQKEVESRPLGLAADAPLSRAMRKIVPTVHPETPLPEVLQAVVSTRLNRAVVVDSEQRVVGVVTDQELLDRVTPALRPGALRSLMHRLPFVHPDPEELAAEQHANARTASDLMSREVATAREDSLLKDAIAAMLRGNQKLVVVVDAQDRLVGIVDRADILRALVTPLE